MSSTSCCREQISAAVPLTWLLAIVAPAACAAKEGVKGEIFQKARKIKEKSEFLMTGRRKCVKGRAC